MLHLFISKVVRKAFEIHFDTNESDRKFILLERRFDVILHHFQVQLKFVILFIITSSLRMANNYVKTRIKEHKPSLNTQSDSIQAKVFV